MALLRNAALAGVLFVAAPATGTPAPVGATAPIDHVVALVDGAPIWWSAYTEALATEPPPEGDAERKQLEAATLDRLIDETLILRRAKQMHIEATDDEVDAALKEIAAQNNFTEAQLADTLTKMGMSLPRYREELRKQILILRAFMWSVPAEKDTPPEKRAEMRDKWIADMRKTARIERR